MFGRFWKRADSGPLGSVFGDLELRVLETLWRLGRATVADVHAAFRPGLAYTTLMTTLDRLYKKGALERSKRGRAFVYETRLTRDEMEQGVAAQIVTRLLRDDPRQARPVLSSLVEAVGDKDRVLLEELSRLVRRKQREKAGRRA
jgi:predicted transcriptional regulator